MNTHRLVSWQTCTRLIVASLMLFACGSAVANVSLWVSNHGTDSGSCGLPSSPCRSISQAIANAATGDTIWVGAGHYGNLSGQPGFGGPGDEQPQMLPSPFETGLQGCIVCVTKALKIYSQDGAAAAIIDSGPSPGSYNATVVLLADGSAFGSPGHGFTITGGNGFGVAVNMQGWGASQFGVSVYSNVDLNDGIGFFVYGPDGYGPLTPCPPNIPQACPGYAGTVLLEGNEAHNNGATGFMVEPRNVNVPKSGAKPIQFIVQNNVTRRAGTGFDVEPGYVECDDCFDDGGAGAVTLVHNFATGGSVGFSIRNGGPARDNLAADNSLYGFLVVSRGSIPPFYRNSAFGNAGPGLIVGLETQPGGPAPAFVAPLDQNDFSGNDRNRPDLQLGGYPTGSNFDLGPSAHCGIVNMGAVWEVYSGLGYGPPGPPFATETLQATQNYWGSSKGPSGSGAGDAAGGACDETGGMTVTSPSAPTEIPITPLPYPFQ
jgi:hypothetical protein